MADFEVAVVAASSPQLEDSAQATGRRMNDGALQRRNLSRSSSPLSSSPAPIVPASFHQHEADLNTYQHAAFSAASQNPASAISSPTFSSSSISASHHHSAKATQHHNHHHYSEQNDQIILSQIPFESSLLDSEDEDDDDDESLLRRGEGEDEENNDEEKKNEDENEDDKTPSPLPPSSPLLSSNHLTPLPDDATPMDETPCCSGFPLLDRVMSPFSKQIPLYRVEHVPQYYKTDYILNFYRVHLQPWLCVCSLFRWHNETFNIWTHLLGFILLFGLCINTAFLNGNASIFAGSPQEQTDRAIFALFLFGASVTALCSTLFHMFGCCNEKVYKRGLCVDGIGIVFTLFFTELPGIYYAFQCFPVARAVHLAICCVLCLGGIAATLHPRFATKQFRPLRAALFGGLSYYWLIAFASLSALRGHSWIVDGFFTDPVVYQILWVTFRGGLVYKCGAFIVYYRVPERWAPGRFDRYFWSHPTWHLFVRPIQLSILFILFCLVHSFADPFPLYSSSQKVTGGALTHYFGFLSYFSEQRQHQC